MTEPLPIRADTRVAAVLGCVARAPDSDPVFAIVGTLRLLSAHACARDAGRRSGVARNRRCGNAVHLHRRAAPDRSAVGRRRCRNCSRSSSGTWAAGQHRTGRRRTRRHPDRHAGVPGVLRHRTTSRCCGIGLPMFETVQQLLRSRMADDTVAVMHGDRTWTWREHLGEASAEASVLTGTARPRPAAARRRAAGQFAGDAAVDGGRRAGRIRAVRDQHHPPRGGPGRRHPAGRLPTRARRHRTPAH